QAPRALRVRSAGFALLDLAARRVDVLPPLEQPRRVRRRRGVATVRHGLLAPARRGGDRDRRSRAALLARRLGCGAPRELAPELPGVPLLREPPLPAAAPLGDRAR